jgi:hypothetical protein
MSFVLADIWLVPRENWLAPLENQAATWQVPSFSPGKKLELHKVSHEHLHLQMREHHWSRLPLIVASKGQGSLV